MVAATDLKVGTTFEMNGIPYLVIKYAHSKIGRGGANVKLTLRNLKTGDTEEKTLSSNAKAEKIETRKKELQFLYSDTETTTFMDSKTFEQVEIPVSIVRTELKFIKEGESVNVLFWDDKPLSVEIPPKVTLEVVETAPGVKGNSATNIYKPAKLENEMSVKVPLFINIGDKIRVDTRTAEYVERATRKE